MVYGNFNILIYKWIIWLSVENEIRGKQKKKKKKKQGKFFITILQWIIKLQINV